MRCPLTAPVAAAAACLSCAPCAALADPYDPLAVSATTNVAILDIAVKDSSRGREIPVRVYLPSLSTPAPVVLFSHGLGGSKDNNPYMGRHWAARGYVCVFMQHPGSDTAVWRGEPLAGRMTAMKGAASGRNFMLRVNDVRAVVDALEIWNKQKGHRLFGRMDLSRLGMCGHSFGAVTTQAVSGQSFGSVGQRFTDKRIKAAIAFSPSAPRRGLSPEASFGAVSIPWMLMTGTRDVSIIGDADVASRLAVFPALPAPDKYELVLFDAEHSAFSDRALPGDKMKRNPNHHRAILAMSTAFWDAYLRGDAAAREWLKGPGPRSVLEPKDTWKRK